jgi:hypothetical protein
MPIDMMASVGANPKSQWNGRDHWGERDEWSERGRWGSGFFGRDNWRGGSYE